MFKEITQKMKSYGLDTYLANEERHVKVIVLG